MFVVLYYGYCLHLLVHTSLILHTSLIITELRLYNCAQNKSAVCHADTLFEYISYEDDGDDYTTKMTKVQAMTKKEKNEKKRFCIDRQ